MGPQNLVLKFDFRLSRPVVVKGNQTNTSNRMVEVYFKAKDRFDHICN